MTSDPKSSDRDDVARWQRVLEARALRLAREREEGEQVRSEVELLVFSASGASFAARLDEVESVARLTGVTPLPGAPAFIFGLVRVRGRHITLLDCRELFGVGGAGLSDATRVIAIHSEGRVMGLAASGIKEVLSISQKEFEAAGRSTDSLTRALSVRGSTVGLIDAGAVTRDPRFSLGALGR